MTAEEELIHLREEKRLLQEQLAQRDEQIVQMQHQMQQLREQVQALQEQLKKDSHNSHLPPSSDRFQRQPKSLRKKSGKKAGGQSGHPGSSLLLSSTPDTVVMYPVERCQHCQHDLSEVESLQVERRQVLDLPRQQCGGDRTPGPTEVLPQLSRDQHRAVPGGRASARAVWSGIGSGRRLSGAAAIVTL